MKNTHITYKICFRNFFFLYFISGHTTVILMELIVSLIFFDEDVDNNFIDDSNFEPEFIKEDCHNSDSDVTLESGYTIAKVAIVSANL